MRTLVMLSALAVPLVAHAAPPAADFNPDEVLKVAREVGQKANVPPDKLAAAVERVREQLPALTAGHPVKGVFAYQMNAGTAVKLGSGLVRFKQSTRNFDLWMKCQFRGPPSGAGPEWGIGLVFDMKSDTFFGGIYDGAVRALGRGPALEGKKRGASGQEYDHRVVLLGGASSMPNGPVELTLRIER
jgi:hypothetical protein